MKLTLLLFFFALSATAQNIWIKRDSVGGPGKSGSIGFSIGINGYIGLGNAADGFKRSVYQYNPIQDDWDRKESLGGPTGDGLERVSAVSFVVKSKAYIGLGNGSNSYYRDFWEYDPATNSWTQKADFGGTGRRQAVAFAIDTMGYVGTGLDVNGYCSDFWKYNVTANTWSSIAPFGGGVRKQAVGFAMGGKGYVGTGDNNGFTNDFWEYNPSTDTWTLKAAFPGTPRYAATGIAAFPDAIVGLGYDNTLNYKADLWRYNANTNTWTAIADFLGGPRTNAVGFVIQQHAYIGCGYNGDFLDDFYEYGMLISVDEIENEPLKVFANIYPNPASSFCKIELEGIQGDDLTLHLYNTLGQEVSNNFGIEQTDYQNPTFNLNTSLSPSGLYFYNIRQKGKNIHAGQVLIDN